MIKIMKSLHCADLGFDCPAVVTGETAEDVLNQAASHAEAVHGVQVTPEIAEQAKQLIREA
jgi:predicted small metal-binding protein